MKIPQSLDQTCADVAKATNHATKVTKQIQSENNILARILKFALSVPDFRRKGKGNNDIDFNIVSSVFGKGEENIVDWINRGLATYINKEKALNYLHHSALRAVTSDNPRLVSATKIVESFENPKDKDRKSSNANFQEGKEDEQHPEGKGVSQTQGGGGEPPKKGTPPKEKGGNPPKGNLPGIGKDKEQKKLSGKLAKRSSQANVRIIDAVAKAIGVSVELYDSENGSRGQKAETGATTDTGNMRIDVANPFDGIDTLYGMYLKQQMSERSFDALCGRLGVEGDEALRRLGRTVGELLVGGKTNELAQLLLSKRDGSENLKSVRDAYLGIFKILEGTRSVTDYKPAAEKVKKAYAEATAGRARVKDDLESVNALYKEFDRRGPKNPMTIDTAKAVAPLLSRLKERWADFEKWAQGVRDKVKSDSARVEAESEIHEQEGRMIKAEDAVMDAVDEIIGGKDPSLIDASGIDRMLTDRGLKFMKAEERVPAEGAEPLTEEERAIRDEVVRIVRGSGIEVVTDSQQAQAVIDRANEGARLSARKRRALETASLEQGSRSLTVVSSADGAKETATIADDSTNKATGISNAHAKVKTNLENLAKVYDEKSTNKTRGFITDLSRALRLKQHEASNYGSFDLPNGKTLAIRISNHNARVSNFDNNDEYNGISIVISSHRNKGLDNDGAAHIIEYFYNRRSIENAGGRPLAEIIKSIGYAIDSGEFNDPTGLAEVQEVNADDVARYQKVYHGSHADFDAFDHSHMGEGEGAQAYGWGTYVTEVKDIGKAYAHTKDGSVQRSIQERQDFIKTRKRDIKTMGDYEKYARRIMKNRRDSEREYKAAKKAGDEKDMRFYQSLMDIADSQLKPENHKALIDSFWEDINKAEAEIDQLRKSIEGTHHLYTVEIPDDNGGNYLDWDGPATDGQIEGIRKYLAENYRMQKLEGFDASIAKVHDATNADEVNAWTRRGENIYKTLKALLGSDSEASKALSEIGLTGIRYPADYRRGGNKEGKKNYVIFNENDLKITDHVRFFRTSDGEAYGFTVDGKIYIDPRIARADTPIHEYAHLWATALRSGNAKEWRSVVGLMKDTPVWDEVRKLYPELTDDDAIADEVLAQYSGRRGAERLRQQMRTATEKARGLTAKAMVVKAFDDVRAALDKFWRGVADFLHIHYTTAEEVADRVLRDLLSGVNPKEVGKAGKKKRETNDAASREEMTDEDKVYLDAVERGDMETAQRIVNEAARRAGYSSSSDYQGTSAFNGAAPYGNDWFLTKEERKRAWDNDEWDGYSSLGDYIDNGVDGGNIEELTNMYSYRSADAMRKEAIENLRDVIGNGKKTITMYRSVPSSVKEGSFRNGDWVTPSKKYAIENAEIHGWGNDYRIIKQEVPVDDVWFDGNDIAEFGYGREADFVNDRDFAYKNTENNRKLLDAVTYDDSGRVILPSERFNESTPDIRFQKKKEADRELEAVNRKFNERLGELSANPNQKGKVLRLGRASQFLKDGGVANAEIELEFDRLQRKSNDGYKSEHPFDLSDLKDLPLSIAHPIAVFDNTNGKNAGNVILTEMRKEGRNFIVAVHTVRQNRRGGVVIEVNKITTLFPKDAKGIVNWFNQGKATNISKEKALRFIGELQNHPGTTIKDEELSSAAKVVESFENPKADDENNSPIRFQKAGGKADTRLLDGKIKKAKADKGIDDEKRGDALERLEQQKAVCENHLPHRSGLTLDFKKKKGAVNVKDFVAKPKDSRPQLEGIHYENGFAVATDGRSMVVTRQDYPRSYEGKTIRKDGTEVEGQFPKWEGVIDSKIYKARGEFDTADFTQALQRAADAPEVFKRAYLEREEELKKAPNHYHSKYIYGDLKSKMSAFRETPILDLPEKQRWWNGKEDVVGIDADRARQILNLIKEIGGDVRICCGSGNIIVEGNDVYATFIGKLSWDRDGLSDNRLIDDEWFFKDYDTRYSGKYQRYDQENGQQRKGPFGTIYEQFRGKAREAVAWLMQKREGEAVGALHHREVGDISLVWGNDKAGLKKILQKHPEVIDDLQGILDGMRIASSSDNRIVLESDTHKAVVSKEFKGQPRDKWLLTAYEKKETTEPAISSIDVESNQGGKSDDTATRQSSVISDSKDTQEPSEKQEEDGSGADREVASKQEEAPTAPQTEAVENTKKEEAPRTESAGEDRVEETPSAETGGGGAKVPPAEPTVPISPEENPDKPNGESEPSKPATEPTVDKPTGELPEDASVDDIKARIDEVKKRRAEATKEYLSGKPHSEQARDEAARLRGELNGLNAKLAEAKRAEKLSETDARVKELQSQKREAERNGDYKEAQKIATKVATARRERKRGTLRGQYEARIAEIKSKSENLADAVKHFVKYINGELSPVLAKAMGKRDFTSLINEVRDLAKQFNATDMNEEKSRDLKVKFDNAVRKVDSVITDAETKRLVGELVKKLKMPTTRRNAKGQKEAVNVNNRARVGIELVRRFFNGFKDQFGGRLDEIVNPIEELQAQKVKAGKQLEALEAREKQNNELLDSGSITQEEYDSLSSEIESERTAILDDMENIDTQLEECKKAADLIGTMPTLTEESYKTLYEDLRTKWEIEQAGGEKMSLHEKEMLAMMPFTKSVVEGNRLFGEVEKLQAKLRLLRQDWKDTAPNKADSEDTAAEKKDRRVLTALEIKETEAKLYEAKRSARAWLENFNADMADLIETGHTQLMEQKASKLEHQKEIVRMGIEAVKGGKPQKRGVERQQQAEKDENKASGFWRKLWNYLFLGPSEAAESMLSRIDRNHYSGEGPLYRHFIEGERGFVQSHDRYLESIEELKKKVQDKCKELFGKKEPKDRNRKITFFQAFTDADGNITTEQAEVTKGVALSLYCWSKSERGRALLEKQGIDAYSIEEIKNELGKEYTDFGDWMVEDFLPELYEKYNEKYVEMYGTELTRNENYFPFRIFGGDIVTKDDLDEFDNGNTVPLPSALKERTSHGYELSVTDDAFNILNDHVGEMEDWYHYADMREDISSLLSSRAFRNMLKDQSPNKWARFRQSMHILAGMRMQEETAGEQVLNEIQRNFAVGAISFRFWTALKQLQSIGAGFSYSWDPKFQAMMISNIMSPTGMKFLSGKKLSGEDLLQSGLFGSMYWMWRNSPQFRERVRSGGLGNLMLEYESDMGNSKKAYKAVRNGLSTAGMAANRFFDAMAVAVYAKTIYDYEYARAIKRGLTEEQAHKMSLTTAENNYNKTQQSSLDAYASAMQKSNNPINKGLTTFQNASLGFLRKSINDANDIAKAYRLMRLGKEPVLHGMRKMGGATASLLWDGLVMPASWNLLNVIGLAGFTAITKGLVNALFGDDDEKPLEKDASGKTWIDRFAEDHNNEVAYAIVSAPLQGTVLNNLVTNLVGGYTEWSPTMGEGAINTVLRSASKAFGSVLDGSAKEFFDNLDRDAAMAALKVLVYQLIHGAMGLDPKTVANLYNAFYDRRVDGHLNPFDNFVSSSMLLSTPKSNLQGHEAREYYLGAYGRNSETATSLEDYIEKRAYADSKIFSKDKDKGVAVNIWRDTAKKKDLGKYVDEWAEYHIKDFSEAKDYHEEWLNNKERKELRKQNANMEISDEEYKRREDALKRRLGYDQDKGNSELTLRSNIVRAIVSKIKSKLTGSDSDRKTAFGWMRELERIDRKQGHSHGDYLDLAERAGVKDWKMIPTDVKSSGKYTNLSDIESGKVPKSDVKGAYNLVASREDAAEDKRLKDMQDKYAPAADRAKSILEEYRKGKTSYAEAYHGLVDIGEGVSMAAYLSQGEKAIKKAKTALTKAVKTGNKKTTQQALDKIRELRKKCLSHEPKSVEQTAKALLSRVRR